MSSVLETFVFLFQSDARALDEGLEASERRARQTGEAVRETDRVATNLGGSFKELAMRSAGVLAAFASVGTLIEGVKAATDFNDKLGETAEALGINVEDLSAWGDAAQMSGGSADEFQNTLRSLNTSMNAVDVTGKSRLLPFFQELGINMLDAAGKARPVMDLLPELAKKFEGMDKSKALGIGAKLGLDKGTVMLLQKGSKGVEELIRRQKELGVTTAEDAQIAGDFNDAIDDTHHVLRTLYTSIGSAVLPMLTAFNKGFQEGMIWLRANKNVVTGFFIAVAAVITNAYLPAAIEAAATTLIMNAPFILTALLVAGVSAAFALLYDDIMTFLDGGDSVIGQLLDWVNSFELLNAAIKFVKALFGFLSDEITNFLATSGLVKTVVDTLSMAFSGWKMILDGVIESFKWIIDRAGQIGSAIKEFAGFVGKDLMATLNAGANSLNAASNNPLAAQTSNSISSANSSNKTSNIKIDKVEVNTQATDSEGISKGISDTLANHLKQTTAHFDDGVRA
jgi:hypothetical protein